MRLQIVIPALVVAAVAPAMVCPSVLIEVKSHDGFKLTFPERIKDAEIAQQLREHDAIAETTLAVQDPRGAAITLRGPEGLTFVYGPDFTRDNFIPDLRKMYGTEMAERVAAGEFLHSQGPDERRLILLIAWQGMSAETARFIIEENPSTAGAAGSDPIAQIYTYKKAYTDGLLKAEIERQERIRMYLPPTRRTVEERIAEARAKVDSMALCRLLKTCGLLWWRR